MFNLMKAPAREGDSIMTLGIATALIFSQVNALLAIQNSFSKVENASSSHQSSSPTSSRGTLTQLKLPRQQDNEPNHAL